MALIPTFPGPFLLRSQKIGGGDRRHMHLAHGSIPFAGNSQFILKIRKNNYCVEVTKRKMWRIVPQFAFVLLCLRTACPKNIYKIDLHASIWRNFWQTRSESTKCLPVFIRPFNFPFGVQLPSSQKVEVHSIEPRDK